MSILSTHVARSIARPRCSPSAAPRSCGTRRAAWLVSLALALTAGAATLGNASNAEAQMLSPRVGVSLAGGGFAGNVGGAYGGLQGRLGLEVAGFAAYAQAQGLIGGFTSSGLGGSTVGALLNNLMFEVGFAEIFSVAAGPGFDYVWGCDAGAAGNNANIACTSTGPYFSADFRAAVRVIALTVSLDVHPMWLPRDNMATFVTLGVGFDF